MKASSESGECASFSSRGSFSVFDAICLAAMGVASPLPGPFLAQRLLHPRATLRVHRKVRSSDVGTCEALGRGLRCNKKPNIPMPPEQTLAGIECGSVSDYD